MKICVIGFGGSGKSRLAISLSRHFFVPVLHLDNLHYLTPNKVISDEKLVSKIDAFINKNEEKGWIIDGNYLLMNDTRRFKEADMIIFLDFPRWYCFKKAKKRKKDKELIDVNTNPCLSRFDFFYIYWVLFGGRNKKMRKLYEKTLTLNDKTKLIFKTEEELESWAEKDKIVLL